MSIKEYKSGGDLSKVDDVDFSRELAQSLTLARTNAATNNASTRASSRESFRSVGGGLGNREEGEWDYGDGDFGRGGRGVLEPLDPGGGAKSKRKEEKQRPRSKSAEGRSFVEKFKSFGENFKNYREAENLSRERGRARERQTNLPRMNRRYSDDEQDRRDEQSEWRSDGQNGRYTHPNEQQGPSCHGTRNGNGNDYRYRDQGWGDRDRQDTVHTILSHTNKHRIRLPQFEQGPVNLKQVKILTQALGEKYSYDGKRGAADFIDNAVNMFWGQNMSETTFKFFILSLLDSAAKKKVGKIDIHRMSAEQLVEKVLRSLGDSNTLDQLAIDFYAAQPNGETVSDWLDIIQEKGEKARVPTAAIWQRFLAQIPIAMALPLDRELRYQIQRYGRYPFDGQEFIHDILGEIVDSTKTYARQNVSGTEKVEKRYRVPKPNYPGYINHVDEKEQEEEPYKEVQQSHSESGMYRQEGDTVVCHNCPTHIRQCNKVTGNTSRPHCDLCGKDGHEDKDCWSKRTCTKCGKTGHIEKVCKQEKKSNYREDCSKCGSTAHKPEECPLYQYERLIIPCPVCQNFYGKSYWHSEQSCIIKKMLLSPSTKN